MLDFNQTALAIDAAANGQGVAPAPRLLLEGELASGRLVELWRPGAPEQEAFHLAHPAIRGPNAAARQAVADWLLAEAGR